MKSDRTKKISKNLIPILVVLIILIFISSPSKYLTSTTNGAKIWLNSVFPSLFPFLFFTKILSEYDLIFTLSSKFKNLTRTLFHTPPISAYIFFSSIVSGYPIGVKLTSDFVSDGKLDKYSAEKILAFSSTSGPLFIVGSVGAIMLKSVKLGIILYVSHIISAIINGIFWSRILKNQKQISTNEFCQNKSNKDFLNKCMQNSIETVLLVGGFIIISNILIDMILSVPFLSQGVFSNLISGLLEVTKGCLAFSQQNITRLILATISFFISFGGISIFIQSITFLNKAGLSKTKYFFQKLTHGLISFVLTILIA